MAGPLAGIRVLDFSVMISGPLSAMMLADLGAEVIKVETPGFGDVMRYLGSSRGGVSGLFINNNRGKRSIAIDVKSAGGKQAVERLVRSADVLIQNFRPGAADRMGIGSEAMRAVNSNLIYVSISGFGDTGPYAFKRVYDNVVQGYSGMASVQTDNVTGEPALLRNLVCDKVTGYTVTQSITAALFARERGAGGQHIDVAMLDSAISFLWPDGAMDAALLEADTNRTPTIGASYRPMPVSDGAIAVSLVTDSEFAGMFRAIGLDELVDDPKFATALGRSQNSGELIRHVLAGLARMTTKEAIAQLDAHDVPCAPLLGLDDLPDDPQVIHNEVFHEIEHPAAGRIRQVRPAAVFHSTVADPARLAPSLGEHTDEVLGELGFSTDEIASMRTLGAIS
jgi:crotonobetainyl-CoA:carnitine CoA-transferase CaiB-like acyl-CoA transferase